MLSLKYIVKKKYLWYVNLLKLNRYIFFSLKNAVTIIKYRNEPDWMSHITKHTFIPNTTYLNRFEITNK